MLLRSLLLLLCLLPAAATRATDEPLRQAFAAIDQQVWSAFVEGVSSFDHARYNGVRSRASVFVDGNRLFDYQEYVDDAARVMAPLQAAGTRVEIEVRFLERLTDGAQARERGVLRSTMYGADGAQVGRGHSNFEAVLRREPGGWRILTERRWRSSDPAVDAAAFEAAHPRGVFEPFLPATTAPAAPAAN